MVKFTIQQRMIMVVRQSKIMLIGTPILFNIIFHNELIFRWYCRNILI